MSVEGASVILCHCNGVTERKIRRVIDHGAQCVDSIGDACGAGTRCGGCHVWLEAMLAERQRVGVSAA